MENKDSPFIYLNGDKSMKMIGVNYINEDDQKKMRKMILDLRKQRELKNR